MKMVSKKLTYRESYAISVTRIIATLMIIVCHLLQSASSSLLSDLVQVFNVGVTVFFFISGFLNGQKKIESRTRWILKKTCRIFIPYYIYFLFIIILLFVYNPYLLNFKSVLFYILNLQGIVHVYLPFSSHLWFISVIFIFYMITPIISTLIRKIEKIKNLIYIISIIGIIQLLLVFIVPKAYNPILMSSNYITYFILYAFGIYLGIYWNREFKLSSYAIVTIIQVGLNIGRLILKYITDANTNLYIQKLYDNVVVPYAHSFFGFWIFITLFFITQRIYNFLYLLKKPILFLEKISFEIYITHYIFSIGSFAVIKLTKITLLNIFLVFFLTITSSYLLNIISVFMINKFIRIQTKFGIKVGD